MKSSLSAALFTAGCFFALVHTACYNPDIPSGSLQCTGTGVCPEGFVCDFKQPISHCVTRGTAGNTGGTSGMGGTMGSGGTGGTTPTGGMGGGAMCVGPLQTPSCAQSSVPGGQVCDPVCQKGCGCNDRCTASGNSLACVPATGMGKVGDTCTLPADNCAPGLLCLDEFDPAKCGRHCYRNCRSDADCPGGAHCTIELQFQGSSLNARVCDNKPESCSPVSGRGQCTGTDRPFPQFGCYIMGSQFPDEAVCDCAGTIEENQPCEFERACKPGLICISSGAGTGKAFCRKVCPLLTPAIAAGICTPAATCTSFMGSKQFGFCAPAL